MELPSCDVVLDLRPLAGGIDHPECVAWHDGRVYCGTEAGTLLAIDPATGAVEVAASPGGFIAGIAFDPAGRCWVCDIAGHRLVRLAPDGGVDLVVEAIEGQPLRTPNFPAVAADGTVWVTDSGSAWAADDGFLVRIPPAGPPVIADRECRRFPNGLALTEAEDVLFVVESRLPGIVAYPVRDGKVGQRREVIRLPGTVPDGLAIDRAGVLYVGCWRPDRIYRLHPDGRLELFLDDPTAEYLNSPTNICFGGPEGRRLYAASLGGWTITQIDVETPGHVLQARPGQRDAGSSPPTAGSPERSSR